MTRWAHIENIIIYIAFIGGVIITRTAWPILLLLFVNHPRRKDN